MEEAGQKSHFFRIDLAQAWRRAPVAATADSLGITTGTLYTVGGLNALITAPLFDAAIDTITVCTIAIIAILNGIFCFACRDWLPRWFYFATVLFGTGLITLTVISCNSHAAAMAMSLHYYFVAVDAAFFFSLRAGLVQYLAVVACAAFGFRHEGLPAGALVFLASTMLAVAVIVAWISRMADAAESDPLTELLNRRGLQLRLHEAVRRATDDGMPLAVAIVDIDKFKQVNDTHSHLEGDRLLVSCATTWRGLLAQDIHLGRYGGDEFVLIFPGHTLGSAADIADRVREATPGGMTASVGVAPWMRGDSASMLMSRVDSALYEAKLAGRNRTAVHGAPGGIARKPG